MKEGTVALVIAKPKAGPCLIEALSDEEEIVLFETALRDGSLDPLSFVHDMRERQAAKDEEFADYIEDLLCNPFLHFDIKEQGLEWFKSRNKIEKFKASELEATQVIAEYAYRLYQENPGRADYYLAGTNARVRIRVYELPESWHPTSASDPDDEEQAA